MQDFASAAFLQEHLLLEHRTQRGVTEMCSACSWFFKILDSWCWGLFSYLQGVCDGAAAEFAADVGGVALSVMFVCSCWEPYVLSVVLWKNDKCEDTWSSTVDRECVSVYGHRGVRGGGAYTPQKKTMMGRGRSFSPPFSSLFSFYLQPESVKLWLSAEDGEVFASPSSCWPA